MARSTKNRPVAPEILSAASRLLDALREKDFHSFAEVRKSCGLTKVRFGVALKLLQKKQLIEIGSLKARGPLSACLRIRAERGYVVAVDIGGTNLRVVIADMAGTILGKWSGSTVGAASPVKVVRLIQKAVKKIARRAGLQGNSLLAMAAGAPGVTDSKNGVVLLTSYLGGWKDVPLGRMLERRFKAPAVVENDVRLGAVGERWRGSARDLNDFVFLAIGTGIAAGIYARGELLRGPKFAAGEVGYLVVPGTSEAGVREGMPGALESAIGGEGIKGQWQKEAQRMYGEALHSLSATEIFERATNGDERAQSVLERSGRILAHAVYNISVVLNCPAFILGGGVGTNAIFRDAAENVLKDYSQPVQPQLRLSSLGPDAQLFGALRLALDAAEKRLGVRV